MCSLLLGCAVLAAIAAATASAAPLFNLQLTVCVEGNEMGHYASKAACEKEEEEPKGKWTRRYGTLAATSGTDALDGGGETVACEKDVASGVISSTTLIEGIVVHFLGCSAKTAASESCTVKSTNQSTSGLILTNTLHGVLGLILPKPSSGSDVALVLLPISGKVFTTLVGSGKCVETTKVSGDVAGLFEPVGVVTTTGKLIFSETGGKQNITDVDLSTGGLVAPELTAFSATATEETTESLTFNPEIEVM
jgi:hypothetical protein